MNKSTQWFEARFIESAKKLRKDCVVCGVAMWFPPSKHGKYLTCGGECGKKNQQKAALDRARKCLTCGKEFIPRIAQLNAGGGKYCSNSCAAPTREAGRTPQARLNAAKSRRQNFIDGRWTPLSGDRSPSWKGGHDAFVARAKAAGKFAEWNRNYRKKNPEKIREFSSRRLGRKTGRLPKGTIKRIGALQKWKCVICTKSILNCFHMDHITPLARGGKHHERNIQLLCPTCNVRKSAKDPIDYMQERGFLL